jgi:thiamine biosynthesis lipoprotein
MRAGHTATFSLSLILAFACALGPGCRTPLARFEFTEVHMGVPVRTVLFAASEDTARDVARAGYARIRDLDRVMSDYRPDSELNALSPRAGEWVPVSRELFQVLARAKSIAQQTGGAFDPTVGPLVGLWREARDSGRLPDPDLLADARRRTGWSRLELNEARQTVRLGSGMRLDLGGIAKGFILDEALEAIRAHGITRVLLEAGGDIVVGDAPPDREGWEIAIQVDDETFAQHAAALVNAALATSGGSVQFVEIDGVRYSHVIDPATGLGLTHDLVVHVIAPDGATADALATALGVVGQPRADELLRAFPSVTASIGRER